LIAATVFSVRNATILLPFSTVFSIGARLMPLIDELAGLHPFGHPRPRSGRAPR
jgi:hypothetical protein